MRVAIIGLGLIGGSWAMALREWSKTEEGRAAQLEIVGFDAKGKQRALAQSMNLCHRYTATPMEVVKDAQIVIVATPVMAIRDTFEDIAEHLENGAIVTDTCSTKRQVMDWARELLPKTVNFVGGHPMAGKTASLEEADPDLFKNCTYCLMSLPETRDDAIDTVAKLVEAIGAKPYFIEPSEHDSYVAAISHLPYLTSVQLVNLAGDSEGWREIMRLASTGFQDTTRLASGDIQMHMDICRTNSDMIISWLDRYQRQLSDLRLMLEQAGLYDERGRPKPESLSDPGPLQQFLTRARESRDRWLSSRLKPDADPRAAGIEMPAKKDLQIGYSRMLFGGLFDKRKKPGDENPGSNSPNNTRKP
ncbi:MAG TPA: prephenate dehydrogenase [Chloroflexia bacterium]|nr:prephenate dehydrogenase [Chloroflexia bacterium]